jgi:hypothetical protein
MQCTKTQYTTQRAFAAPAATRRDGDGPRDVVLVVVHDETERSVKKVFNKFTESRLSPNKTFRAANDVVAIGQEAGHIGGRVGSYIENVPYVFGESER